MFSGFGTATSSARRSTNRDVQWRAPVLRMPRFRLKGMLERNALADLWKHTLSQIPSTYGRLAYLASLRDANSGVYRHHGLSAAFGREESVSAMRKSHQDT